MTRSGRAKPRLVLMTRFPSPGAVKTRLAATVGDVEAARIHTGLAEYCARRLRAVELSGVIEFEARVAGPAAGRAPHDPTWTPPDPRHWPPHVTRRRPQHSGDLGARLAAALRAAFDEGAPAAIAVGSDCPDLGGRHVRAACAALEDHDVVLGPATDGGYYLVGVRAGAADRVLPRLFGGHIPWGTPDVLSETLTALRSDAHPAHVHLLEPLSDVDTADDLAVWTQALSRLKPRNVTAVIPTLNEASAIGATVAAAFDAGCHQVIVSDASDTTDTARHARTAGAQVIEAGRGRAVQMNAGAQEATGGAFVFVHADTRLPEGAAAAIVAAFEDPAVSGGGFGFSAGVPDDLKDRVITAAGRARYRLFALPYGDQAQVVRAQDFEDLGGYPPLPTMEDYEFALRLKALGSLARLPGEVVTSTRAWREHGLVRTTLVNMAVIGGYRLGMDPPTLARWRRRASSRA